MMFVFFSLSNFLEHSMKHSLEDVLFSSLKVVEVVTVQTQTVPLAVVKPWTRTKPLLKLSLWYTRTRKFKFVSPRTE